MNIKAKKDVSWADRNAWAPCIIEKKNENGNYKYYYFMAVCELNDDMVSVKPNTTEVFIPNDEFH